MASIEKRQTRHGVRYRARITLKGHPRLSETFSTRRKATRWAERTTEALRQRRFQPEALSEQYTLGELVDRYIATAQLVDNKRHRSKLQWWCDQLGRETRLSHITPESIAQARDRLASGESLSGKVLTPGSVKRYLSVLSAALSTAVKDWFWMADNPCLKVRRPTDSRGRIRFLDDSERERLLAACKASPAARLYPLVLMALCTGARQRELLDLTWQQVDLDRGLAVIHHSKNGDRRAIAITGPAETMLADWYRARQVNSDLVFPSPNGKSTFPQLPWNRALATAEIEDFRFHDLRHTFASYLAMSGATLAELAEALGHKTLAMVKRYAHLTEGHTRSVVERMTGRFLE